jgi:hypothetical protein
MSSFAATFTVDQTPDAVFAAIVDVRSWWTGDIDGAAEQLKFVEDKSEWNGTKLTFDIARRGEQTEVRFTHVGLLPEGECYDSCSSAWRFYINTSLRERIATQREA